MIDALDGGCTCRDLRYRLSSRPLFVHACHCRWCQRESGSAFALNALIESERVQLVRGTPERVLNPTASGAGQLFCRCPRCKGALWSHYAGSGPSVSFVRVGTLDHPDALPPDVHIFAGSRQPWLVLPPDGAPVFDLYYERERIWPADSLRRLEALAPQIEAWRAGGRQWP